VTSACKDEESTVELSTNAMGADFFLCRTIKEAAIIIIDAETNSMGMIKMESLIKMNQNRKLEVQVEITRLDQN